MVDGSVLGHIHSSGGFVAVRDRSKLHGQIENVQKDSYQLVATYLQGLVDTLSGPSALLVLTLLKWNLM